MSVDLLVMKVAEKYKVDVVEAAERVYALEARLHADRFSKNYAVKFNQSFFYSAIGQVIKEYEGMCYDGN